MRPIPFLFLLSWLVLGRSVLRADAPPPAAFAPAAVEFFEQKVRPVLAESCVRCHGPKKQSGGLRLDAREAVLEGGENGPAVVPGDPDKSLLIQAIRQTRADVKMPPKGKLSDLALAALTEWVRRGVAWSQAPVSSDAAKDAAVTTHWAFQPIRRVAPPLVPNREWVATPIDAFIVARLEAQGMAPGPRADKRTLIRRASFDLLGLPPTPEEVAAFEADPAPDAFAKVVARLLAAPQYGERWGRHWLDVARYADTKGYVFQQERRYPYSYTYRDYVIRAFNEDTPYDQFLVEQLAADRLPTRSDNRALAALGFLTVGRRFLNNNEDIIDDRIDVVTRGLLGLTVACARCHDHKFDPIPTDDYYSLHGVFASSIEPAELPVLGAPTPSAESADFQAQLAARQKERDDFLAAKRAEIQTDLRNRIGVYLRAAFDLDFDPKHPKFDERARTSTLAPSRLRSFMVRWKTVNAPTASRDDPIFGPWRALASLAPAEFAAKAPEVVRSHSVSADPLVVRMLAGPPSRMDDVVDRYSVLFTQAQTHPEPEWEAVRRALDQTTELPADTLTLFRGLDRAERVQGMKLAKAVEELQAAHPGAPARAMVLNDVERPINPHVSVRGNPGRPGKAVPRQFLKVLSGPDRKPFPDGSGRLDLARAIADPANPLTARVFVNRVWGLHFGQGLVDTPSDFGVRSEPPTHPELLDWLASEFIASGWSIKGLHRRIMLSSVYQQVSDVRPTDQERDPRNRWLGRFNRQRLDFEALRDTLLALGGGLDPKPGGRAVPISDPPFSTRRTVYGFIDRQNLDDLYRTFDFASPDTSSARRFVTTVPQQALFLMNSPFVLEQAQRLAARAASEASEPEVRVGVLYRRLYGRAPEPQEVKWGLEFVRVQTERPQPAPIWQNGFGGCHETANPIVRFAPLSHWTGSVWQFSPTLPDPKTSYLSLSATGGHVGPDPDHAAIRRWTAPRALTIAIEGALNHEGGMGDGVRGRIIAGRGGLLGSRVAFHAQVPTPVVQYAVEAGETIDFVADCRADDSYDSFLWAPTLRAVGGPDVWDAAADFQGPPPPAVGPWEEYAQVLLLTNELMFVD